ncbi:CD83 antigen [Galemys pyrenaicus]|uniref:CD83 antigen n=1 Tax=Galemys pyrenaicus TaxID=202257 RepID=A0A8J6A0B1_GALPY|nr:CD83 antigen [Galemys pyrenaicus]
MSRGLQLLILSCACSLAPAAREVMVACSEDVDLPCTAPWDPQVSYTVSWTKLMRNGEERLEVTEEDLQYYQKGSTEATSVGLYSLKIRNTTSCHSGTYKCMLEELAGQTFRNGTVILKVTGCPKEGKEDSFNKYRADIVLLVVLVIFYLTLIIFTCKFARYQSIFPDFSKPGMEPAFLAITSPKKPLELVTLHKTELV